MAEKYAELKKRGVSGFTLMEMLIVIAIIAVLVAIAIPVMGAQLNSAKDAADEANARSIYALLQADIMAPSGSTATSVGFSGGNATVTLSSGATQVFKFSDRTSNVTWGTDANGVVTVNLASAGGNKSFPQTATSAS